MRIPTKFFKENEKDYFDLTEFPDNELWGKYRGTINRKRVNWMQDEYAGNVILDMVVLKSKMYAMMLLQYGKNGPETVEKKKSKGIPHAAIKHQLKFEQYMECKNVLEQTHVNFKAIRSFNHNVFTIEQEKKALNALDTKRYYIDSTRSLPYGHKDINKM